MIFSLCAVVDFVVLLRLYYILFRDKQILHFSIQLEKYLDQTECQDSRTKFLQKNYSLQKKNINDNVVTSSSRTKKAPLASRHLHHVNCDHMKILITSTNSSGCIVIALVYHQARRIAHFNLTSELKFSNLRKK